MPHIYRNLLIACIVIFSCTHAYTQDSLLVSGSFKNLSFSRFVDSIEKQSHFRFYYQANEVDSLFVTAEANQIPLQELLEKLFKNTPYRFSIDKSLNVYITEHNLVQTELPRDFFDRNIKGSDTADLQIVMEAEESTETEKIKSSNENRLFEIGSPSNRKSRATIAGYVRDRKNGEALIGAAVYIDSPSIGAITDQYGYYSITLPAGRHTLHISSTGMKDTRRQLAVYGDGKLIVEMDEYVASLKAVEVVSEKLSNVRGLQMGTERLSIKKIKQVPVLLGEADVMRVILTLPGVSSAGEASTGFNVRGGSTDQNLILFNDATIYNPSHLFGFFSAFNPDVVKGLELYKSTIPERYGGRLSSVLHISARDGNNKKWSGNGGIGPLTSKLTIEGPIVKEKSSFILGGRTTYSNWLLGVIPDKSYKNSRASFYDVNLNINHTINPRNNLYLTAYASNDQFRLNSDTLYKYSNRNINLKWKHNFSNKLYGTITAGYDQYKYEVSSEKNPVNAFQLGFDISQASVRADFNYSPGNKHNLNFGFNSIFYKLHPGSYTPESDQSLVARDVLPAEQAVESALYIGDQYELTSNLSVNAGLRYSFFNYLSPHDVYNYAPGLPKSLNTLRDTTAYTGTKIINTYHGPEIRLAARYSLSDNASIKASYNTLRQYIHMLSNTTIISPTDVWKLSDPHIEPQLGSQVSLGYYHNFKSNTIETSVELYYKRMKNYLDYKSGASIVLNRHIETDVIGTKGRAYGAEFMVKKSSGKMNGWISYTYSKTQLKMDDSLGGEMINKGNYYPANFDKPHNLNIICNYRFSHRYSVSMNVVYSTGRPVTIPVSIFTYGGSQRVYYSERNQYRIPDYFRADLSVNIEGNHKIKKLAHSSWSLGVYNLTGRQNAYSVYFTQEAGQVKGYQLSVFGTLIPFITYNFRF